MKLHKRIFEKAWAQNAVTALIAGYLRFVRLTARSEYRNADRLRTLVENKQPVIVCFWHGRLVPSVFGWQEKSVLHILSTPHRDGQIAAKAYNRFGIQTIWGSTKKGGTQAARTIIKVLKSGGVVGITPDGPKGPRQRMQMSALDMARMSGAMLLPFACSTSNAKWLNSWDRMMIPLPFGRAVFAFGEPIEVPRKGSPEELEDVRQIFEQRMNDLHREADAACGQITPEPAALDQAGSASP